MIRGKLKIDSERQFEINPFFGCFATYDASFVSFTLFAA